MISPSCALFGFPPELNEDFLREHGSRSLPVVRAAAALTLAIDVAFAFWPTGVPLSPIARGIYLGYLAPALLLWIALTFRRRAPRTLHRVSFVAALGTVGLGNILFIYLVPMRVSLYQPGAVMLVTMLLYGGLRLPFLWATSAGWTLSVSFLGTAARTGALDSRELSLSGLFLLSTNALGMWIAFSGERSLRRDFLRRRDLAAERARAETLLLNILPAAVATRLKAGEKTIADDFDDVTVLFADLVNYTEMAGSLPATEVVAVLNEVFSRFDALMEKHGAEKIKTIGDAYMAVCGLPGTEKAHADGAAALALEMLTVLDEINARRGLSLRLRVGVNSGPVVAGVIGSRKFIYDLWGDAVNVAARMESHGVPGRVHLSESAASKLTRHSAEKRGVIEVKGKGAMTTYLLA